jgi:hypothetical protein
MLCTYELHVATAVIEEKSEVRKVQVDELVIPGSQTTLTALDSI